MALLPSLPAGVRRFLRWCRNAALAAVALYLAAGFLSLRLVPGPGTHPAADMELDSPERDATGTEVRGAISVHSGRSHDAEGSLEQVAAAAARTGLDLVILGDHPGDWMDEGGDVLAPRRMEDVLLVPGLELVISGVGRTLAVGLDTLAGRWDGDVASLSARADSLEGFLSVVHPRSPRGRERWNGLEAPGVHAWESFDVSEMARLRLKDPWAAYHVASFLAGLAVGRGHASLLGLWREGTSTPAILAYDSARATRPLVLTGGLNHHPKARRGDFLFPAYEPFFRTVVNHLLLEDSALAADPLEARAQIVRGLRSGRLYVSLGGSEDAGGFDVEGLGADQSSTPMGGRRPWGGSETLLVHLPKAGRHRLLVRIMRDGNEAAWLEADAGRSLRWPLPGPGVYRVEVFRAGMRIGGLRYGFRPWILSNPLEFYSSPGETTPDATGSLP